MKRFLALVLVVILSVCITACNSNKNNNSKSTVEQYKSIAQEYIDKGDMETAKKVLEEGVALTNDEELKDMLEKFSVEKLETKNEIETIAGTTVEKDEILQESERLNVVSKTIEVPDYTKYNGTWSTEGFSWENGGLTMDILLDGQYLNVICSFVQSAPMNRIASFEDRIPISNIVNSSVSTTFNEDGWGNMGTVTIRFKAAQDYYIECNIKDIIYSDTASWGFDEGDYKLFRY